MLEMLLANQPSLDRSKMSELWNFTQHLQNGGNDNGRSYLPLSVCHA